MLAPGETGQAIISTETIAGVLSTGVPAGETYSATYRDQTGRRHFVRRDPDGRLTRTVTVGNQLELRWDVEASGEERQ